MPDLKRGDVEWVVNNLGELGVKIKDQFFFLYKGCSLVYKDVSLEEEGMGDKLRWRPVYKREFGECCHSDKFYEMMKENPHRGYDSYGDEEDWQDLPESRESRA